SLSGVTLDPECLNAFQSLKIGKKVKYIVYRLSDDQKSIVVDTTAESSDYDDFVGKLPKEDCRWAVYDFDYSTSEGERSKIVFISWSPENAKIKAKMTYSASKDALRKALNGVGVEIQGTDFDEVAHESILERIRR
ncbi:cofilin, partial [Gryganskiella cystojenkinii]